MNGAARLMKDASPTPTSLEWQNPIITYNLVPKDTNDVKSTKTTKSKTQYKDSLTHMRHIAMDQKLNELPHPAVANVQTDNPTPISLKGLWLQGQQCTRTYKSNGINGYLK